MRQLVNLQSCTTTKKKKKKKKWNTVDCRRPEKIWNTRKVQQNAFYSRQNKDRMPIFEGILFFKATNKTKTNKLLGRRQLVATRRMCARPKSRNDVTATHNVTVLSTSSRPESHARPSGRTQLAAAKWFVCFCVVCGFQEGDSIEKLHSVLFCFH